MKQLLSIFILMMVFCSLLGQDTTYYFNKLYGLDYENNITASIFETNGGYLVIGNHFADGTKYINLTKYDEQGDSIWNKTLLTAEEYETFFGGQRATPTPDGNYLMGYRFIKEDYTAVGLLKFDKDGTILWNNRSLTNLCSEMDLGIKHLIPTLDGGFIWTGWMSCGATRMAVCKTDSLGNIEWLKPYVTEMYSSSLIIHQHPNGDYVVGGRQRRESPPDEPDIRNYNPWVVFLNDTGKIVKEYEYGDVYRDSYAIIYPF